MIPKHAGRYRGRRVLPGMRDSDALFESRLQTRDNMSQFVPCCCNGAA
jgi:hypothetical protein